jgi:hypothetical protein
MVRLVARSEQLEISPAEIEESPRREAWGFLFRSVLLSLENVINIVWVVERFDRNYQHFNIFRCMPATGGNDHGSARGAAIQKTLYIQGTVKS